MLTNFSRSVDFAQSLCFVLFCPPLEELFKHGWLSSIIDHFNVGGWRIAFGLDKTLVGLKKDISGDTLSFLQTWEEGCGPEAAQSMNVPHWTQWHDQGQDSPQDLHSDL